jgi:hypothetical protein
VSAQNALTMAPHEPGNSRVLQATRFARRISIGNTPSGMKEADLLTLFNQAMMAAACSVSPGCPVLTAHVNQEHRFGFVELRSVEEASNMFVFDGLLCGHAALAVRRPNEYSHVEVRPHRWCECISFFKGSAILMQHQPWRLRRCFDRGGTMLFCTVLDS